jgi:hypothetical protein
MLRISVHTLALVGLWNLTFWKMPPSANRTPLPPARHCVDDVQFFPSGPHFRLLGPRTPTSAKSSFGAEDIGGQSK